MERKWSIRAYREGDEEGIFELDKAVHPSRTGDMEQWLKWWHWMYKDNPNGAARIWLAEHDGKIVGQYPLIFMKLKADNETLKVSQNIDVMTHPDYRYQGMFSTLERQALNEAEREGVCITIGFPNKAAYPGHIKSGWFDVATLGLMLKPLNWENTLKIRIRNRFLLNLCAMSGKVVNRMSYRPKKAPVVEGLTITQVSSFDERFDDFWARVSDQYLIMVVRSKDYLNWRYGTPGVNYSIFASERAGEIDGYLVLRCRHREGIRLGNILDIMAQSEEVIWNLVSRATKYCQQERVDLIYWITKANRTYYGAFKKSGFLSIPFMKAGRFIAYSSSPQVSKAFLQDSHNWFVQMGDSDAIE